MTREQLKQLTDDIASIIRKHYDNWGGEPAVSFVVAGLRNSGMIGRTPDERPDSLRTWRIGGNPAAMFRELGFNVYNVGRVTRIGAPLPLGLRIYTEATVVFPESIRGDAHGIPDSITGTIVSVMPNTVYPGGAHTVIVRTPDGHEWECDADWLVRPGARVSVNASSIVLTVESVDGPLARLSDRSTVHVTKLVPASV